MTDLISRADAIEAVRSYFKDRAGKSKCDYDEELQAFVIGKEELTMLTYNKGINDKLRSLPSADAVPQLRQTDTLIIADALRYLAKDTERHELDRTRAEELREQILRYGASMCSSADAVQGEWEFVDNEIFAGEYFCSICGKRAEVDLYGEWILSNYCGHCGTRMKGGAK